MSETFSEMVVAQKGYSEDDTILLVKIATMTSSSCAGR